MFALQANHRTRLAAKAKAKAAVASDAILPLHWASTANQADPAALTANFSSTSTSATSSAATMARRTRYPWLLLSLVVFSLGSLLAPYEEHGLGLVRMVLERVEGADAGVGVDVDVAIERSGGAGTEVGAYMLHIQGRPLVNTKLMY
jgi:hypothetical protein